MWNSAGGMKGCAGSWVVLGCCGSGMGWLDPLSFLFLLLVFRFYFSFLWIFLASETYTKSRASEQTIILRCTTLHYPFIIHHTITFPPPVLPSSRRSIDLVHQRRSPAPIPLPSLPTTTGRRGGVAGEAGSFSTIVTFPAMLFVWREFLRQFLAHSFSKIGGGADGSGWEKRGGVLFVIVFGYVVWCDEDRG